MMIGYARVSTEEQNLGLQLDALRAAGCETIFEDQGVSGSVIERDGLDRALAMIGTGDVLVVWKLDRLGRSLGFLIDLIDYLGKGGAGFKSLSDGIDTTTSTGKLVFHIMGALAEFERSLIAERTSAGMKAAKRRGKHVGRPFMLTPETLELANRLIREGKGKAVIARMVGVHPSTLRRALNAPDDLRGSPARGKRPASVRAGKRV
jgi:DNA invertase Pin-like site-specific DNA recombinase